MRKRCSESIKRKIKIDVKQFNSIAIAQLKVRRN